MESIVGVFEDSNDVDNTILGLEYNYFDVEDISIVVKQNVPMKKLKNPKQPKNDADSMLSGALSHAKKIHTRKGEFSLVGPVSRVFSDQDSSTGEIFDVLENFGLLPPDSKLIAPFVYDGAFLLGIQSLSPSETNYILKEFQKHNAVKTYQVKRGGDK